MRLGWLAPQGNEDGSRGGAELTADEFAEAAPNGTELVACPPGDVKPDLDCYVIHTGIGYRASDYEPMDGKPKVRYHHDTDPHSDPDFRYRVLLSKDTHAVFLSPLHQLRFPHALSPQGKTHLCPPAIDLEPFREANRYRRAQLDAALGALDDRRKYERRGTLWLGQMLTAQKGVHRVVKWAEENGPVDFYGDGPYAPKDCEHVNCHGPVEYDDLPAILARYERFVHLPTRLEPFGRTVVEAWAAGCKLVLNENVGAAWWIRTEPLGLEVAALKFWRIVEEAVSVS